MILTGMCSISIRTLTGVSGNPGIFPRAKQVSTGHLFALPYGKAALSNPSISQKRSTPDGVDLFWRSERDLIYIFALRK